MVLYRVLNGERTPMDLINNATDDTASPRLMNDVIANQQRMQTESGSRPQARANQKQE